jgi:uncharacterized membrane protein
MSARTIALVVAVILFGVSGCALLAIEHAPLPESWDAFILSMLVLVVLVWVPLILGAAIVLLLAVSAFARQVRQSS